LYPVAFVLRFRIKKVEERIKCFVKSEQTLKRWVETMARNLHKKYGFRIDNFDFEGDIAQFINFWNDFKRKNHVTEENNHDVDLGSCCGVTDLKLDAATNQFDNPGDYDMSKQAKPEEESTSATDDDSHDEEMDNQTVVQMLQIGLI
uniref:Uncharacterized protein n=1 Tax=Romanomermis culicivorax TaxID=13658 RepID=A0A915KHY1_ROMCU